ncbi:MAG: tail fiber domain-containing protein [Bacteriovoracaceae bacterium]|jgi:hypothetical protein|nr:tail fiber domain-containing protein [Bacteriovoracaceae bacterium]
MLKKILKSQSGLSLVEVMVAASISIVVAMGVVKINEISQKNMSKIKSDMNLMDFKTLIVQRLGDVDRCTNETIVSNSGDKIAGLDIQASDYTMERLDTSNGALDPEFIVGQQIFTAPRWKVKSAYISQFSNGGVSAAPIGTCDIVITVEKMVPMSANSPKSYGAHEKILRIPMRCLVDTVATGIVQECQSSEEANEQGYWKAQADSASDVFIQFLGISGDPRAKIGPGTNDVTAALTLNPLTTQLDGFTKRHALSLPTNGSITLGDSDDVGIFHGESGSDDHLSIAGAEQVRVENGDLGILAGSLTASQDVSAGNDITAAQNITATNGNITASSGNIISTTGLVEAADTIRNTGGGWIVSPNGVSAPTINSANIWASSSVGSGQDINAARDVNAGRNVNAGSSVNATTVNANTINANQANVPIVNGVSVIPSDERYKKEISDIDNALEQVMELRGTTYFMRIEEFPDKHFPSQRQYGVIAQELEKVFPNLVYTDPISGYKSVQYANMVAILIEAIKEHRQETLENKKMAQIMREGLQEKNQEQDRRISALEKENKELKGQVEDLKKQVEKLYLLYQKEK